ncbi:Bone morphogenetic protein 2-B [Dissostichus eleginoides]|uniref:Bone morphogenetic protein 2-B n=1 Tax=Dissostichus eleginoides TaxID=100907 RepID=A0AAD9ETU1_DISEL|nr:Bone morphogenetic protein 2-B [Dissostichus eleginoides]
MTVGALRLWVLLALRMRCVTLLALPLDTGTAPGREHRENGAPQFMLDLFNAVTVSEGRPKSQKEILEGNIVRSFEDKGNSGERFHFFNLSSKKQKFYLGKSFGPHFYKVDLYEVLDSRVKPWRGNLITSRLVPLHTQGWEVFNVTQTVSKWIRNSQENNGILVRSGELTDTNAYLVLFSDDGRTGASNQSFLGQPHPAAPELQDPHSRRRRASPGSPPHSRSQYCQRVPLFVDFEEIGWSGWIISPRGYNAYHCKGSCPFPLGGSLKATNHATVRSIMHALKLSSDEYDDMVASCGCH